MIEGSGGNRRDLSGGEAVRGERFGGGGEQREFVAEAERRGREGERERGRRNAGSRYEQMLQANQSLAVFTMHGYV